MLRTVGDTRLWVEDVGEGPPVVFSHGLLWSTALYRPQIAALQGHRRCIAWDHRGQGRSDVPPGRSVSIETCTEDAIALLDDLGLGPVDFVGLSMGGFVGMRVAARRPDLVRSLALLETAADPEPKANKAKYTRLLLAVQAFGVTEWISRQVLPILCGEAFLTDPARDGQRRDAERHLRSNAATVTKAVRGVLERGSAEAELARIACPTLVLWGTGDRAIARHRAKALQEGIRGAVWVELEGPGHSCTVEDPEPVTQALLDFWVTVGEREETAG